MKSIIQKTKIILIAFALLFTLNWANASFRPRPTNCTPPNCDAPVVLNTGPSSQSVLGDLTIGTSTIRPNYADLDVQGSLSADSLIVSGMTVVTGNMMFNNLYFKPGQSFNGQPFAVSNALCIITTTKQVVRC
jgi:hypothetical protein